MVEFFGLIFQANPKTENKHLQIPKWIKASVYNQFPESRPNRSAPELPKPT